MPWNKRSEVEQRLWLVQRVRQGTCTIAALSREAGLSRQTIYKWLRRYREQRLGGLRERSRKPLSNKDKTSPLWLRRIRRERLRHPTWGARKLRWKLRRKHGADQLPAPATISRWLKRWGLSKGKRRQLRGRVIGRGRLHVPRRCHEVWTVDFKGWYRTGQGQRVHPLTVRDLYSRYGLAIELLSSQGLTETRKAFRRIFREHGVPERIRCDNGTPFGGAGPTRLTRLSVWWMKLGIQVEFIRPGKPCDNGAHEQFHRIYKAEVADRPSRSVRGQQERSRRWLRYYNEERPHQALGDRRPRELYRRNRRRLTAIKSWDYPGKWLRKWVKGNGEISHQGNRRYVGEAFARDMVGLKPIRPGSWEVYFREKLVGELRENESGRIRMARYE
jgi:putative transposase